MDRQLGGVYGFCVGDALGVPAEFNSREALRITPIEGMEKSDNPKLPAGTWSDDSSMMLCLMDSLAEGLDYDDMMVKYYRWFSYGEYTPVGYCFDIGNTTRAAVHAFAKGKAALECGSGEESDNGNGSLMRSLPLAFYLAEETDAQIMTDIIHNTSTVTHSHKRCHIAASIYVLLCVELLHGVEAKQAAENTLAKVFKYYKAIPEYKKELVHFAALENFNEFIQREESEISSSGYVIDTLEAALWCFYNTHSYRACVLRAVNLGDDADTVAAVAGGLAGIYYGYEAIPKEWLDTLQGKDIIEKISDKFFRSIEKRANKPSQ